MKSGLYQIISAVEHLEEHGGVVIQSEMYWNLGLYPNGDFIIYGSDKDEFWQYEEKRSSMIVRRESISDEDIVLCLYNNEGGFLDKLKIKKLDENRIWVKSEVPRADGRLWLNSEFVLIEMDYNNIKN